MKFIKMYECDHTKPTHENYALLETFAEIPISKKLHGKKILHRFLCTELNINIMQTFHLWFHGLLV